MFDSNVELALAGYNGGPYRIKRLWKESGSKEIDRFLEGLDLEESKTYVKRILVLSDSYRQLYPQAGDIDRMTDLWVDGMDGAAASADRHLSRRSGRRREPPPDL